MKGLEMYDIVEDIEVKMNEIIEDDILVMRTLMQVMMFSLDEVVVKDNTQELGDLSSLEGPIALHPEIFISHTL